MKTVTALPENYCEVFRLDLQKDTKKAVLVNIMSLIIAAIMLASAYWIKPYRYEGIFNLSLLKCLVLLISMVSYIFLHELVHGIFMRYYSDGVKVKYGFTGLYAYAGSEAYFCKKAYIVIALAPVVILGALLLILNVIFAKNWFWVIYFIQTVNISGAAGDIYVVYKFSKLPQDILVQDSGTAMTVFSH